MIGVLAGVGLAIGAILYCCCGVGKKKKQENANVSEPVVIQPPVEGGPPAYGEGKQMGHEVIQK